MGSDTTNTMYASIDELESFLADHPETAWLDAFVIDLCGNAIGKRLPRDHAARLFTAGTPICGAMQLVDVLGNTSDPMGYGFSDGDPDAIARPLRSKLAPVFWSDGGLAQVMCELTQAEDGQPLWYDPRQVLQRVVSRYEESGVFPVLALELEFYLTDLKRGPDGAPRLPYSPLTGEREFQGKVLSIDKLEEFTPLLEAIQQACHDQGVPSSSMISEYGAGQFEINLEHQRDPLLAADHAALLRRVVKGVSRRHGYGATFMAKPFADQSGNGLHIHLSLEDKSGTNLFRPDSNKGEKMLGQAIAGLQATMSEGMALFAPDINAYRRFKPDEFTPVTRDWGENNRSMAFRLPPSSDAGDRRLEHRIAGAEANPYLVTAAVLAGVHHGLSASLAPTAKKTGNAGSEIDDSLPMTLRDALDALERAKILGDYLGADYLNLYAEVKRAEFSDFMDVATQREYDWYL